MNLISARMTTVGGPTTVVLNLDYLIAVVPYPSLRPEPIVTVYMHGVPPFNCLGLAEDFLPIKEEVVHAYS